MATPTTTFDAVRDQMISVIEALVPASLPQDRFRRALGERADLRAWALEYPDACFRRFDILDASDYAAPIVSDGVIDQVEAVARVVVAYPSSGKFGDQNRRDAMGVMRADRHQIDDAIGLHGGANTVAGQTTAVSRGGAPFDLGADGDGAIFTVLELGFLFYRAVNT